MIELNMRPNIFDYATSELSQDAFLAWFCRWADQTMTDDEELHNSARAFLKKYIAIQQSDYTEDIRTVKVQKQHEHIDVFLTINDNLFVIIEDKIHAYKHDNQLIRYSDAISGKTVKLYIKTGDEALSHKMNIEREDGYTVIYRDELLQSLESCNSRSEILTSFVERLKRREEATLSYSATDKWNEAQLIGFYKAMERVLPNAHWGLVNNPSKGNWVLNWRWSEAHNCRIYLEFSIPRWCVLNEPVPYAGHMKLFVKITSNEISVPKEKLWDHRHTLLHQNSRAFIAHANGLVQRPHVLRTGKFMTIAEVGFDHFLAGKKDIDVNRIAELLHPYETAVKTYADKMNLE